MPEPAAAEPTPATTEPTPSAGSAVPYDDIKASLIEEGFPENFAQNMITIHQGLSANPHDPPATAIWLHLYKRAYRVVDMMAVVLDHAKRRDEAAAASSSGGGNNANTSARGTWRDPLLAFRMAAQQRADPHNFGAEVQRRQRRQQLRDDRQVRDDLERLIDAIGAMRDGFASMGYPTESPANTSYRLSYRYRPWYGIGSYW